MSWFCANFGSNLAPFWQPWTPQIDLILTPVIYPTECKHWTSRLSHTILLQIRFLVDFGGFRRLQDVSKAAQDASRRLQNDVKTLPRRLKRPLDTSKTGDAVHFWQETFLSLQRTITRSASTKCSSQFTIYSFIFTIHNWQVSVYRWKRSIQDSQSARQYLCFTIKT